MNSVFSYILIVRIGEPVEYDINTHDVYLWGGDTKQVASCLKIDFEIKPGDSEDNIIFITNPTHKDVDYKIFESLSESPYFLVEEIRSSTGIFNRKIRSARNNEIESFIDAFRPINRNFDEFKFYNWYISKKRDEKINHLIENGNENKEIE